MHRVNARAQVHAGWRTGACGTLSRNWDAAEVNLTQHEAQTAVAMGERLARYGFPGGHPFGPDRHGAFQREFEARGLGVKVAVLEPAQASMDDLLLFHTRSHIESVQRSSEQGSGALDGREGGHSR